MKHFFPNLSEFELTIFPNLVEFELTTFPNSAEFELSTFPNLAEFELTTFSISTKFELTTFSNLGESEFRRVRINYVSGIRYFDYTFTSSTAVVGSHLLRLSLLLPIFLFVFFFASFYSLWFTGFVDLFRLRLSPLLFLPKRRVISEHGSAFPFPFRGKTQAGVPGSLAGILLSRLGCSSRQGGHMFPEPNSN